MPTTVNVTPSTAELPALGATVQLSADVCNQSGRAMPGAAVSWASGGESVATVDASGLMTAVANGTLEPAFVVKAPRSLPESGGEYRLAGVALN